VTDRGRSNAKLLPKQAIFARLGSSAMADAELWMGFATREGDYTSTEMNATSPAVGSEVENGKYLIVKE